MPDVSISDRGTIVTFLPLTDAAVDWIDEHVGEDAPWLGGALCVEARYAFDLAEGMACDGLTFA